MARLTPKQARFVAEYLVDLNATQAAVRAGYSAKTARQAGSENLTKPAVSEAVADAQAERAARASVTADWVVQRLAAEAQARGPGSSHAARVAALAHLGKHLGMFAERNELAVAGEAIRVTEVKLVGVRPGEVEGGVHAPFPPKPPASH